MESSPAAVAPQIQRHSQAYFLPLSLLLLGLVIRVWWSSSIFLNADEAMHYVLADQSSLALTYQVTLSTAHPPLYIVMLHYWKLLRSSEFFLRLPSLIAGIAFCWMMFLWLRNVADRRTGLIAMSLALFSPALIYLSAEIRQYSVLLFFCANSLYFLDRALIKNSIWMMLASTLALYLAMLSHYSSVIFGLVLAIYALLRFRASAWPRGLSLTWVVSQLGALALALVLLLTHVLKKRRMAQNLADSYLRGSIFHAREDHILSFMIRAQIRVFHFLFSQGAVAVLGLALFIVGIVLLLRNGKPPADSRKPNSRQLGLLLLSPFAINCATALAGLYPYGGTRHNSYLALFAMPAIAVAVARWPIRQSWIRPVVIALALAICNLTVTPAGAYIRAKNQKKELMTQAMAWMHRHIPADSVIFTDLEGGLLLSYYYCHHQAVQLYGTVQPFMESACSGSRVISMDPRLWVFKADTFPAHLQAMEQTYDLNPSTPVWIFQAGFIVDKEPDFRAELRQFGCAAPQTFGENILICRIAAEARDQNQHEGRVSSP